mgnify:CR=1 FL=1
MRYRLQRHDGTDCSATMVPITVLRMVPIQRYRQKEVHTAAISGETWYKIRGILYQSFCNLVTGDG